jgi:hypothetical protein
MRSTAHSVGSLHTGDEPDEPLVSDVLMLHQEGVPAEL